MRRIRAYPPVNYPPETVLDSGAGGLMIPKVLQHFGHGSLGMQHVGHGQKTPYIRLENPLI